MSSCLRRWTGLGIFRRNICLTSENLCVSSLIPRMEKHMSIQIRPCSLIVAIMSACVLFAGCGKSDPEGTAATDDSSSFLDDLLGDVDLSEPPLPEDTSVTAQELAGSTDGAQRLELRLSKGDTFPLVKSVEQTLVQKSEQYPENARTRLDLHMVITAQDVRDDAVLLNVKYTRVVYEHDVLGQHLNFDSERGLQGVPANLLPYAGMVGNGFAFWLNKDNRIGEVVGYSEFLQQCVRNVPPAERQQLLTQISARFGNDGVASFVDETVGLLPYNSAADAGSATQVAVGDVWTRERRVLSPVPVNIQSTCRLLSLDDKTAEIDIKGSIAPDAVASTSSPTSLPSLRVTEGRSMGSCVIDRTTGLPLQLNRSQYLTMAITTADGREVEQQKRIQTTIRTFPEQSAAVVQARGSGLSDQVDRAVFSTQVPGPDSTPAYTNSANGQPTTGVPSNGFAPSERPLSSTVRAVYPD